MKRDRKTVRKIAIAAAVSLSLSGVTGVSHALGLGEIEMYSALNQSLDAEIEILSATEDELQNMQVSLASSDAFARAGLDLLPVLSTVVFAVDNRPDGKAVVKVTSDSPVLEPFLNFLIEVNAPGSVKLVREYTVLLNPPTFADAADPVDQTTTFASERAIGSGTADGGGVAIDLTTAGVIGGGTAAATTVADNLSGNDTGNEVIFTETTAGTFTVPVVTTDTAVRDTAATETDNLFVPDEDVFAETDSAPTVTDNDGVVISLEQELNLTPEFDEGVIVSGSDSTLVSGNGEPVGLGNLGAQDETDASDNAIFGNEFDSDAGGEVIAGEELRTLVGPDASSSEPTVQFTETVVPIPSFESESQASEQTVAGADATNANTIAEIFPDLDFATNDSDAAGNQIDLSGVINELSPGQSAADNAARNAARNQAVETSGETYRIKTSDTLWSIANAQKERSTSPHQMMVALLDANPTAFVNGNMNRLRNGAVLQIPTTASQTLVEPATALAIVSSWTRDNKPPVRNFNRSGSSLEPVIDTLPDADIVISDTAGSDLASINSRLEQAQNELAEETMQRDDLQGRVDSLTDNVEEIDTLITLRENDLQSLQDEVTSAESDVAAIDAQINELSNASTDVAALQQGLNRDLAEAQEAINRQADLEKNLADAEAQAQSVRISSEEDSLRAQLAALEIEKRELVASSQMEKADLVREAEAEKTSLLAQAKAERERIMSELEDEKARIGIEAEAEIARIKGEAVVENQRVLREAQEESERLQAKLEEVEAQKMELEKADAARVSEEQLAKVQQEALDRAAIAKAAAAQAAATQAAATQATSETDDTDAAGMVDKATDTGESMLDSGSAAVGGLLGFAPLQELIGNRKNVLAVGAGVSLLGLLAAWGLRRRKHPAKEEVSLRPRAEAARPVPSRSGASYEQEQAMYGEDNNNTAGQVQQRTGNSSGAAAAAAAAAAVTGTAGVAATKTRSEVEAARPAPEPVTEPAPAPQAPTQADNKAKLSAEEEELEAVALDDTITEAEVYLRYGLHGQAEDLLKTAIERSPDNQEYHFKLLENYYDQKNPDDFKKTAMAFTEKFPSSGHAARIAEMEAELNPSSNKPGAAAGVVAAGAAATGAAAAGAIASAKNASSGGIESAMESVESGAEDLLDQTIDPGSEFSVDELQATGNLGAMADDTTDFGDVGGMALDDFDNAALDDDGTMNLEEVAGSQMSGGDLGTMDLTNSDVDSTFDNLTLEDAELNSLGNAGGHDGGNNSSGIETDLPVDSPIAGGADEMETMLDLAKAYIDMGDDANASKALKDIAARGNPLQQTEANELLKKLK